MALLPLDVGIPPRSSQVAESSWSSNWFSWLKWNHYDEDKLLSAEETILRVLKTPYRGHYVELRGVVDPKDRIWSISLNEESKKTPIVLLHGLASGSALWCLSIDALAAHRPVHAIDVLGFGKSSRPTFSADSLEATKQMVEVIEAWRREMQLEKMIILGHSFGGYLASAYGIQYPDRVKHLILADSWGYPSQTSNTVRPVPNWAVFFMNKFLPFSLLRAAGPFGEWMFTTFRTDLIRFFEPELKKDSKLIPQYIYRSNLLHPSGEIVFKTLSGAHYGWAEHPMIDRIGELRTDVPMTVLVGGNSLIDGPTGDDIKERRSESFVNFQVLEGAAHHLYAEKYQKFNELVIEACRYDE